MHRNADIRPRPSGSLSDRRRVSLARRPRSRSQQRTCGVYEGPAALAPAVLVAVNAIEEHVPPVPAAGVAPKANSVLADPRSLVQARTSDLGRGGHFSSVPGPRGPLTQACLTTQQKSFAVRQVERRLRLQPWTADELSESASRATLGRCTCFVPTPRVSSVSGRTVDSICSEFQ